MNRHKYQNSPVIKAHAALIIMLFCAFCSQAAKPSIKLLKDTVFLEPYDSLIIPAEAKDSSGNFLAISRKDALDSSRLGIYIVKLYAVDGSNNASDTFKLTVIIQDRIAPTISLNGPEQVSVKRGQQYVEKGYIVIDNFDPSPTVTISGSYDNSEKAGQFTITYQAQDKSGNKSKILVRNINVIDTSSGIESFYENPIHIKTWPNPASGMAYIELGSDKPESMHIALYDLSGREQAFIAAGVYSKTTFTIPVENLPTGVYLIKGFIGNMPVCSKILVRR